MVLLPTTTFPEKEIPPKFTFTLTVEDGAATMVVILSLIVAILGLNST